MNRHKTLRAIGLAGLLLGFSAQDAPAAIIQLINNGSFDQGGGSLAGWTVTDQFGGSGTFFLQSTTVSPDSGFDVPLPQGPPPTFAAMTDQTGPGSHLLTQEFVVPAGVNSAIFSFVKFVGNRDGDFATPNTLSWQVDLNQQARVDFVSPSIINPFSIDPVDVLLNAFQTHPGDNQLDGEYSLVTVDVSSLLQQHAGETLRLRFAEVDNHGFFQFGVSRVSITVATGATGLPEPASAGLLGIGLLGLLGCRLRSRTTV